MKLLRYDLALQLLIHQVTFANLFSMQFLHKGEH